MKGSKQKTKVAGWGSRIGCQERKPCRRVCGDFVSDGFAELDLQSVDFLDERPD